MTKPRDVIHPVWAQVTEEELVLFSVSLVGLVVSYFVLTWLLPRIGCSRSNKRGLSASEAADQAEKQRGWILTGLSAAVMTVTGAPQAMAFAELLWRSGFDLDALQAHYFAESWVGRAAICFFAAHCVADTVIGYLLYPGAMDMLSGYIHHAIYIFTCFYALNHADRIFMAFAIEEFPTFLLAIGNLDWHLRHDSFFGWTFFALRLGWHVLTLASVVYSRLDAYTAVMIGTLTLGMHIYWWKNWFVKYYLRGPKKPHQQ
jgi:hypothetical protein